MLHFIGLSCQLLILLMEVNVYLNDCLSKLFYFVHFSQFLHLVIFTTDLNASLPYGPPVTTELIIISICIC